MYFIKQLGYAALSTTKGVCMNTFKSIKTHRIQSGLKPIKGIKNIIAVASGKGGVGKSTISANLACSLQLQGARVGLLDADIYGPSQAMMLASGEKISKPAITKETKFAPFIKHNLQIMSMAYLVEEDKAAIWRGPMVSKALMQLLLHTAWDNLDYLILDLPPGTGGYPTHHGKTNSSYRLRYCYHTPGYCTY